MLIGVVLVIFGVLFLLQNLGYFTYDIWNLFWPLILIAIGLKVAIKGGHHDHHWCCGHHQEEKKEERPQ
jgi:hypothetical protein